MASNNRPWYWRPVSRWATLRAVPYSRLWILLLAAFLLFSIPGFYSDIMSRGIFPYSVAFVVAAITGLNAALWIFAVARLPVAVIPALILVQFFLGPICTRVANGIAHAFNLEAGLVLTHIEIDEKSNEIPAAQRLLGELQFANCTVTLDAMHCQKKLSRPSQQRVHTQSSN